MTALFHSSQPARRATTGGAHTSLILRKGQQILRLTDIDGGNVSMMMLNPQREERLNLPDTAPAHWRAWTAGHRFLPDMGRVLAGL